MLLDTLRVPGPPPEPSLGLPAINRPLENSLELIHRGYPCQQGELEQGAQLKGPEQEQGLPFQEVSRVAELAPPHIGQDLQSLLALVRDVARQVPRFEGSLEDEVVVKDWLLAFLLGLTDVLA